MISDESLQRIKARYDEMKGWETSAKEDREKLKNSTRKHAEALREKLPGLPLEKFYSIKNGQRDDELLSRLQDNIGALLERLDAYTPQPAGSLQGVAEDYLVSQFHRLCDKPTCYKSAHDTKQYKHKAGQWTGGMVDFMYEYLPYFGISTSKTSAFAKRYDDWRKRIKQD